MYNNLFYYATKELSQDAFICWLLSFAMKGCRKDPALTACAEDFLRLFARLPEGESVYLSEEPKRQYKHVDILLTVNDLYKIIIEDKTDTSERENQLTDYRAAIENEFSPKYKVLGVYFKTSHQSNLSAISEADYLLCNRKTILSIMQKHKDAIQNNIFQDYYERLNESEASAQSFRVLPIQEWGWNQINEFYDHCQNTMTDIGMHIGYGYVNNRSGGFMAMWLYHEDCYITVDGIEYELYLQCEFNAPELKIRYRASADDNKIYGERRDRLIRKEENGNWKDIVYENNFQKPSRYGAGRTVALGDYQMSMHDSTDAEKAIRSAVKDFRNIVAQLKA